MAYSKIQKLVGLKVRLMAMERNISDLSVKRDRIVNEIQEVLGDGPPSTEDIQKEKQRLQTLIDSISALEKEGQ